MLDYRPENVTLLVKKTIIVAGILLLLPVFILAQDLDSGVVGYWTAQSVTANGTTMPVEELIEGVTFTFEMRADGSCHVDFMGEGGEGRWYTAGGSIFMSDDTGKDMSFKYSVADPYLHLHFQYEGIDMIFNLIQGDGSKGDGMDNSKGAGI